jgi:hypothetical protein
VIEKDLFSFAGQKSAGAPNLGAAKSLIELNHPVHQTAAKQSAMFVGSAQGRKLLVRSADPMPTGPNIQPNNLEPGYN